MEFNSFARGNNINNWNLTVSLVVIISNWTTHCISYVISNIIQNFINSVNNYKKSYKIIILILIFDARNDL